MSFRIRSQNSIENNEEHEVIPENREESPEEKSLQSPQESSQETPQELKEVEIPKNRVLFDPDINCYVFLCPHCEIFVEVEKNAINCGIFRHAYFFQQQENHIVLTEQIGPHTSKQECERLLTENRIVGCANPFRLFQDNNGIYTVEKCGFDT